MKHITEQERDKIAIWLAEKHSFRDISRWLGRSVSSVCDEVERNNRNGVYSAIISSKN